MRILHSIAIELVVIGCCILAGCQTKSAGLPTTASTSPDSTPPPTKADANSSDSAVRLVRNGVLAAHNSTTLGKALEGTFREGTWKSFETAKGQLIVEFDGTSRYKAVKDAGFYPFGRNTDAVHRQACGQLGSRPDDEWMACVANIAVPVKVQFAVSADRTEFSFFAFDGLGDATPDQLLAFVYQ